MTEYLSGPGGGLVAGAGAKSDVNAMFEMTIMIERKTKSQRGFCM